MQLLGIHCHSHSHSNVFFLKKVCGSFSSFPGHPTTTNECITYVGLRVKDKEESTHSVIHRPPLEKDAVMRAFAAALLLVAVVAGEPLYYV